MNGNYITIFKTWLIVVVWMPFILYLLIMFLMSIYNYRKFKYTTYRLLEESNNRLENLGLDICQINGSICKQICICRFDEFRHLIRSHVESNGQIHVITNKNDIFFNILENHLIGNHFIVIDGIAVEPKSYIDYIRIMYYIVFCEDIILHINDGSKRSDSLEELHLLYVNSLTNLQKMSEFENIDDVVIIKSSPLFLNKKIIWKNNDTNTIYMHGYDNSPISMLAAIVFYTQNKFTRNEISKEITNITNKFVKSTKMTTCLFEEDNIDEIVVNAIDACKEGESIDRDKIDICNLENNWKYMLFSRSIWKSYIYENDMLNIE